MMKKWTALLLALALCGSLAACVGGTQPAEDAAEDKETVETVKPEEETDKQDEAQKEDGDTPTSDQTTSTETDQGSTSSNSASSAGSSSTGGGTSGSTGSASSGNTASNAGSSTTAPSTGNSTASKPQTPAPAPQPEPEPEPEPAEPTAAQASGYIGGSASALESALGSPSSKSYSPSCMGEGEDGIWNYGSFTVYTYRETGTETVEAVQ